MLSTTPLVFACYSKACAPPPAGKGGSSPKASNIKRREWGDAIRNGEAIFDRGDKSFVTRHKRSESGKTTDWAVYQGTKGQTDLTKVGGGTTRDHERALKRILDIVLDGAH